MSDLAAAAAEGTVSFTCPRCATEVEERLYGPCTRCRSELQALFVGESHDVVVEAYEPKMNVTPNAVAVKE